MPAPFRRRRLVPLVAALAFLACGDDPVDTPPQVSDVDVQSAIGAIVAAGRTAQLDATALTNDGAEISGSVSWSSNNESVATVDGGGTVTGHTAGVALITAEIEGVQGSLQMRVVNADLSAVGTMLGDPLRDAFVDALPTTAGPVSAALATADAALVSGNITALADAFDDVFAVAAGASNPDDRAILATVTLLTEYGRANLGL